MRSMSFLLAGVGGQGTILASNVLAQVGLSAGYEVKQAEVHGMSQRGGSVTSYVRWGDVVYAPLVGAGDVDVLLAFEQLEALRYLFHLRHDGLAVVNLERIEPVTVSSLGQHYPDDATLRAAVAAVTPHVAFVDGPAIAATLGDPKVSNTALLGALSQLLEDMVTLERDVPAALWLDAIARRVPPKSVERNRAAFQIGRSACMVTV